MVRYLFDDAGGFLAGDDTLASYAYPTSIYAERARRNPAKVASEMLAFDRDHGMAALVERFTDLVERNVRYLDRLAEHGVEG